MKTKEVIKYYAVVNTASALEKRADAVKGGAIMFKSPADEDIEEFKQEYRKEFCTTRNGWIS